MEHKSPGQGPDELEKDPKKPVATPDTSPPVDAVANTNTNTGAETSQESGSKRDPKCFRIPGFGDRMHHLAMTQSSPQHVLRMDRLAKNNAVAKVAPTSRAQCGRSRGTQSFCDPSHPASCGGKFCGRDFI